jgi:hypothetical protein
VRRIDSAPDALKISRKAILRDKVVQASYKRRLYRSRRSGMMEGGFIVYSFVYSILMLPEVALIIGLS